MASTNVDFAGLYQQQDPESRGESVSPATPPPSYGDIPGVVPLNKDSLPGPPPSYDEANNPNAPPPSYESLFGRVREARRNSSGFLDFLKKLLVLILGTIGCSIAVGVTIVIPVAMVAIGSLYIHDCPAEPYIPIYLVVGGVFGIVKNLINFRTRCRKRDLDDDTLQQNPVDTVINCFLFAWFIAGCVWVYRVYEPNFSNPNSSFYCNKTLYIFAFWIITAVYVALGILAMCLCCVGVMSLTIQTD